jgi:hypothetical protein
VDQIVRALLGGIDPSIIPSLGPWLSPVRSVMAYQHAPARRSAGGLESTRLHARKQAVVFVGRVSEVTGWAKLSSLDFGPEPVAEALRRRIER